MGMWCCMYINEFHQNDQSTHDEMETVQPGKDLTPEELALLTE